MTEDMFAQKGWICPKCGRVLAPSTMYCLWCCSDMKVSITTTPTTTIPKWDTTPIKVGSGTIDPNCTGRSYFVETSSISRDSHEIAKNEPQTRLTAKCLECNNSKACKENHWEGCKYEPLGYEVTAVVGTIKNEPQTERGE